MRRTALITLISALIAPAAWACGPDTNCPIGDRHYRIAMPDGHDGVTPVGAVVFAHGYRGTARGLMRNGSLRRMLSNRNLALIALKSEGDDWNLPNAPRKPGETGVAEMAYVTAVLDDAVTRFSLDETRMMATGFSAGGMMTWNMACTLPDRFAGFAPIAGTFWKSPPDGCVGPIANVVHIHGDADRTVPLAGRQIADTQQGDVFETLEMYAEYGDFSAPVSKIYGDLDCSERTNPQGDILDFCLFPGGHSFRSEFVSFAWDRFVEEGAL